MFLEHGRVNWKLNPKSRRIYNISGMPDGCLLVYAGCNKFPSFPIREDGDSVHRARQLESRTNSADPCRSYRNSTTTDASGFCYGVQAVDRTSGTSGSLGRRGPIDAGMVSHVADFYATERESRFVAVIDYDED
jgi:hypothetical protein